MEFTMRFSAYPDRQTAFQREVARLHLIHGTSKPGSPWQNGIVERSHRTDNEELFNIVRFTSSEERRYMLKLWDYHYNTQRPHQGLHGRCPQDVYLEQYTIHARSRMLI
jgi:transposase InsO family protein